MFGPQTATANFAPVTGGLPNNYVVSQIATNSVPATGKPINNFGQVVGSSYGNGNTYAVFLWTPVTANGTVGSLSDLGALPISATPYSIAAGINDHGQVAGTTSVQSPYGVGQAFLWSPSSANATSGNMVAFLGGNVASSSANAINALGQIAGNQTGGSFLWTPSSPNGSTGTANTDSRLNGITQINDFGQAIIGAQTLFTPSVANGGTGNFTQIFGLSGATGSQLQAINKTGTILGVSCIPNSNGGQCNQHGFLWIPSSANGTTGAATEIALGAALLDFDLRVRGASRVRKAPYDSLALPTIFSLPRRLGVDGEAASGPVSGTR
jgi:uncharacterized membrane protein